MRRAQQKLSAAGAAAIVALVGAGLAARRSGPASEIADPAPRPAPTAPQVSPPPGVALLVTRPGGSTALVVSRPGEVSLPDPIARFDHGAEAVIQGAVLPGPEIVVLALADGELVRLAAEHAPQRLAGGLVRGSRPLITPSGQLFVAREGDEETRESRVEAMDPVTGACHTLHAAHGQRLGLAGVAGREVVIHRVGRTGADLVAVDEASGTARVVAPEISPYARDFSVGEGGRALVFETRDADDARAFTLERIDLATGARRRLYTGTHAGLAPFAWPGGGVAYSHEGRAGLALLGGACPLAPAPFGAGVDRVLATAEGGGWVAGIHVPPGGTGIPVPFVIDTRTGAAAPLPSPPGARAYVAGFVADRGAGLR